MTEARRSVVLLLLLLPAFAVHLVSCMVNSGARNNLDEFNHCLRQKHQPGLRACVGRTAISYLQRFDERENVTLLADLVATRDDKLAARSLVNMLDADPVDFRGILENAGAVFSQRSLQWHMDRVYPGLMLKIGPTANANSVVEFVLDPNGNERDFGYEEASTARVLAKNYLVPFLLGLKFNLVALVPLLFAGICLLLKKALFFAKLAIYVSGFLGVGGVASALGSLGGLGGLGFGGLGGGGGFLGPPLLHGHAHSLDAAAGAGSGLGAGPAGGYFPGKTSVFNHYDADELHHNSPYKRTDRKVNFEKPRDFPHRAVVATTAAPVPDRFYEYEKQVLMQERPAGSKMRNGKLGPSAFDDDPAGGWQAVDIRSQ